jgi:predicted enzyme related to lactoylglutathione lyase
MVMTVLDGAPIWVDLACDDLDTSKTFYASVLGWTFQDPTPEAGGWTAALANGEPVAGLAARRSGTPHTWSMYLACADADATLSHITELGGSVFVPAFDIIVGGVRQGRIAAAADPTGGLFGLWQPDAMQGVTASGNPGYPQWFELNSSDPVAARDFYVTLFTGKAADIGDPLVADYTSVTVAGSESENFGIWTMPGMLPNESTSQWFVYFAVRDVDAAAQRATEAGGMVVRVENSMHGRWAYIVGIQGEQFYVIDVNVKS